jgi:aspartate--ammonia ligase
MAKLFIPEGYESKLTLLQTEVAIKETKDFFEHELARVLSLTRVSAPLFVKVDTGLNDNLNGVERPVAFDVLDTGDHVEIVHSLAKWKRMALHRYEIGPGEGLYTDMNAIRRDEELDNLHSIYVDQWDWEKHILREERTEETLREIVEKIYGVFKATEAHLHELYPALEKTLPERITFLTTQELEEAYPDASPKEREDLAAKRHGAVFLMKIGGALASGEPHDGRAPDYDDWNLNGDILFYNPILDSAYELSSMGIRVDEEALEKQLEIANAEERKAFPFHRMLLSGELPYSVGGGIGQSRICMYFLQKAHIGEVQAALWPDEMIETCEKHGIKLL